MNLLLFKTLWGHDGSLSDAVTLCKEAGIRGIEAPAPSERKSREVFFETMQNAELQWIAEISTCTPTGVFVPTPACSVEEHLKSLDDGVRLSLEGSPRFINTMAGYDAWSFADSVRFHEGVLRLQDRHDIVISVETHRGRSTYSPWLTRDLLEAVPELRITCDFSHWCVVSERLILDEEVELLHLAAEHAHHIQPRVGYSQGPQVPDPRAPEHAVSLHAHERWWSVVWDSMAARGFTEITMTPEFGPDGYLQAAPFTRVPVGNLWDINRWMGHRQVTQFHKHFNT
jgi:hypothetical protein